MSDTMSDTIDRFKSYRDSHPNLSQCWLAYLELKKRHYGGNLAIQSAAVLHKLENGHADLKTKDIVSLLLFTQSIEV